MFEQNVLPLASIGRRIASLTYEVLLLAALFFFAGFALLPIISPAAGTPSARVLAMPPLPARILSFAYYLGIGALYFGWFWSKGRQTLPMKTWRLRLVDRNALPLVRKQALLRYFAGWIGPLLAVCAYPLAGRWGLIFCIFNYCWAGIDRDEQFLHDRLAGTCLVRL